MTGGKKARELNDTIRYTMWSVFRLRDVFGEDAFRLEEARQVDELVAKLAADDVVVRGHVRAQRPPRRRRRDGLVARRGGREAPGRLPAAASYVLRWPARAGVVTGRAAPPAEFNKSHIPAFLADEEARAYVCVYPFVRSYEWYLLEDSERRRLLAEHGQMAREYPDVRANTVASFALGDYEWMLAFEADELHRIVDLMRHLRGSETRRHVREEVPFYTGRRRTPTELVTSMP